VVKIGRKALVSVVLAALVAAAVAATGGASGTNGPNSRTIPLVIGHRGASGYRPEQIGRAHV